MADVLSFPAGGTAGALRARFVDSLTAEPDDIDLQGAIEERRNDLNGIIRDLGWIRRAGRKPGLGTAGEIERVASRLLQTAEAIRLAKKLPAIVELPADCERGE